MSGIDQNEPDIIVAQSHEDFVLICKEHGWNPRRIRYARLYNLDEDLSGYYADQVYPEGNYDLPMRMNPRLKLPARNPFVINDTD